MKRLVTALVLFSVPAFAAELPVNCPPKAPSCKILILTPEEEQALVGDRMIFQTASQARFLDVDPIVKYFLGKIAAAPSGKVVPEPAPAPATIPPK
jgi:hypothetical protein